MSAFSVTDLEGFADCLRKGAAESISENYTENLDDFITIDQIKNMIHQNNMGYDDEGLPIITENIFDNLFERIREDIYQVGLAKLAANGKIECAWDSDTNQMVFWTPESS